MGVGLVAKRCDWFANRCRWEGVLRKGVVIDSDVRIGLVAKSFGDVTVL